MQRECFVWQKHLLLLEDNSKMYLMMETNLWSELRDCLVLLCQWLSLTLADEQRGQTSYELNPLTEIPSLPLFGPCFLGRLFLLPLLPLWAVYKCGWLACVSEWNSDWTQPSGMWAAECHRDPYWNRTPLSAGKALNYKPVFFGDLHSFYVKKINFLWMFLLL